MATFLPDVNVWIALAVIEHTQHREAIGWFESTPGDRLAFCRVTQMGFLRLLTNPHVMQGAELTLRAAWRCLDRVYKATSPIFAAEPALLETAWRGATRDLRGDAKAGPNLWTDAYLAAFAQISGFIFVTFDRRVPAYRNTAIRILEA